MYWCAACGNPEIIVETDKRGYSIAKGIVGSAVLGPVGAVAGLDGKDTVLYYCPKCGARLNKCMSQNEVSNILQVLKEAETSIISKKAADRLKKKYPNMFWPDELNRLWSNDPNCFERNNANSIKNDNSVDLLTDANAHNNSFSGDIKKDITDYLNRVNAPVKYPDIKKYFQQSAYSEINIINGILDSAEEGLVKCYGDYFALVRDLDEMAHLRESGNDNRKKIEEDVFGFKNDLEKAEQTAKQKQEERVLEKLSNIYKMSLLSAKTKAQNSQDLCYRIETEIKTLELKKGEEIRRIQKSIDDLMSYLSANGEDAINDVAATIALKESEIKGLSFLQFSRKKELNEEIESLRKKMSALQIEKSKAEDNILNLQKEEVGIISRSTYDIETKKEGYELEKKELEKWTLDLQNIENKIEELNQGIINRDDYDKVKYQLEQAENEVTRERRNKEINKVIEESISQEDDFVTVEELKRKHPELSDASDTKIEGYLQLLRSEGCVNSMVLRGKQCYRFIKNRTSTDNINPPIQASIKGEIEYKIYSIIKDSKEPVNVRYLSEKTNIKIQKIGALANGLEKQGIIKSIIKDKVKFYYI